MITEFGMSEKIGPLNFGSRHEHVFMGRDFGGDKNFSEEVASLVDQEVKVIITTCYERARQLLTQHKEQLDLISYELIARETLDADEFDKLFRGEEKSSSAPATV